MKQYWFWLGSKGEKLPATTHGSTLTSKPSPPIVAVPQAFDLITVNVEIIILTGGIHDDLILIPAFK